MVALVLASRSIHRRAGFSLFTGVAVFGLATIVFGLSKSFWLSLVALATLGGADMVSVYVRQTLVQIVTPDAMRGRVASVSFLFIGASNDLGEEDHRHALVEGGSVHVQGRTHRQHEAGHLVGHAQPLLRHLQRDRKGRVGRCGGEGQERSVGDVPPERPYVHAAQAQRRRKHAEGVERFAEDHQERIEQQPSQEPESEAGQGSGDEDEDRIGRQAS